MQEMVDQMGVVQFRPLLETMYERMGDLQWLLRSPRSLVRLSSFCFIFFTQLVVDWSCVHNGWPNYSAYAGTVPNMRTLCRVVALLEPVGAEPATRVRRAV